MNILIRERAGGPPDGQGASWSQLVRTEGLQLLHKYDSSSLKHQVNVQLAIKFHALRMCHLSREQILKESFDFI